MFREQSTAPHSLTVWIVLKERDTKIFLLFWTHSVMAGKSRDRERRASPSGEPSNTLARKWHSIEMSLRKW